MFCLSFLLLLMCGFVHARKPSIGQWSRGPTSGVNLESVYNIQNYRMPWWNASEGSCDKYRRKLLTLNGQNIPSELTNIYGKYWIGAIAFPEWKWSDGSRLYTYKGFTTVNHFFEKHSDIPGNSVSMCHSFCRGKSTFTFGLKGGVCYCLTSDTFESYVTGERENPCPGNLLEKCGNDHGLSVYTVDGFLPDPTSSGECTYVKKEGYWVNQWVVRTESCEVPKCAVCFSKVSGLYYSSTQQSWNQWNRTCALYKVTGNRWAQLKTILTHSPFKHCGNGYWIGLRRYTLKKWLSGKNADVPQPRASDWDYPKCLALHSLYWWTSLEWTDCSMSLPSICETVHLSPTLSTIYTRKSTSPRGYSTKTSNTSPIIPSTFYPWVPFTRTSMSTIKFEDTTPQSQRRQNEYSRYEIHSSKTGVYVGTCLGLLALVALLLVLGLSYRRKRFCFKPSKNDDEQVYFDASQNGMIDSSNHAMSQPTSNPVYSIPVATIRPTYQNHGFKSDEGTDYYNVSPKLKSKFAVKKMGDLDGEQDNHYEVPLASGNNQDSNGYTSSGVHIYRELESFYEVAQPVTDSVKDVKEIPTAGKQIYNAVEADDEGWGDEEWEDDTNDEQNNGVYSLAGKGMEERKDADTLPVNFGSVIQSRQNVNDLYNTLGQNPPAAPSNNVYNHLNEFEGTEDVDASYDTAMERDLRVLDDDYCHTAAIKHDYDSTKWMNRGNETSKPRNKNIGLYENTAFAGCVYENVDASEKETSNV